MLYRGHTTSQAALKDVGIRHLKVAIGGGFKQSCNALLDDIAREELDNLVRVCFIDTDVRDLEGLPEAVKLILNDVRAADLLEPAPGEPELVILGAANLGNARLIDNIEVAR